MKRPDFLRALFPVRCPFCGELLRKGYVCPDCVSALPPLSDSRRSVLMRLCRLDGLYVPFRYTGKVREAFHAFKFRDKPEYARVFAEEMAKVIEGRYDLILFAPMRYRHRNRRGYNQSELLARELSKRLSIPCVPLLVKYRENREQHGLTAEERSENIRDVYTLRGSVLGLSVLLVDDIITTGSTMLTLCGLIRDGGAVRVDGTAFAAVEDTE